MPNLSTILLDSAECEETLKKIEERHQEAKNKYSLLENKMKNAESECKKALKNAKMQLDDAKKKAEDSGQKLREKQQVKLKFVGTFLNVAVIRKFDSPKFLILSVLEVNILICSH